MDNQGTNREGGAGLRDKIRSTKRGIFFVHAAWSSYSHWALARFKERVHRDGVASDDVVYLDAGDGEDGSEMTTFLQNVCDGYGEVAVVRDGLVAYVTTLGQEKDQFDSRWNQIMSAYNTGVKN